MLSNLFRTQMQSTSAEIPPEGNYISPWAIDGDGYIGDNNLLVGVLIDLFAAIGGVSVVFILASSVGAAFAA